MPKCTNCGRKGLFLILKNGLCNDCISAAHKQARSKQKPVETGTVLNNHEKEEITVRRVTLEDMKKFTSLPFEWNCNIKNVIGPSTKPYAYMDIVKGNVKIVVNELEKMNGKLRYIHQLSPLIPLPLQIPTQDVLLNPRTNGSYSQIVCTPHSYTGRISKYPASLSFKTELHKVGIDTTNGDLFYDCNGAVAKARIIFWRNHIGYFVYFQTVNKELIVTKIESTVVRDNRDLPGVIYKASKS